MGEAALTAEQIEALVAAFEASVLPLAEWHHREHLVVAAVLVRRFDGDVDAAMDRMRDRLHAFLAAHGIESTPDAGYHETLTRAWLELAADFARRRGDEPIESLAAALATAFADKRYLLRFYARDTMMGQAARGGWVEPDLGAIDAGEAVGG